MFSIILLDYCGKKALSWTY